MDLPLNTNTVFDMSGSHKNFAVLPRIGELGQLDQKITDRYSKW
jgi:hypothetical protein